MYKMFKFHWQVLEEFVLSGTYQCMINYMGDASFLTSMTWILGLVWEAFTLCLVVWIAVKHFCELWQHSTSGIIEDCFMVLMKTHLSYFARWDHDVNVVSLSCWSFVHASFLAISCFQISLLSPMLSAVCKSVTDLYIWPWSIISIGCLFPGHSDLS
jgi:hypothetical protein